jgi:uncharacterized protein with GYD domain
MVKRPNYFVGKIFLTLFLIFLFLCSFTNAVNGVVFELSSNSVEQYDFIDIYEAPNEETAAKVSIISQANGAMSAESLTAIPYKRFLELTNEI